MHSAHVEEHPFTYHVYVVSNVGPRLDRVLLGPQY